MTLPLSLPEGCAGRLWPLYRRLLAREILGRYRGSLLGLAWSLVTPLAMLAVYTFVFGFVFRGRWADGPPQAPLDFALTLFAGLIVFNLFAEVLGRAPGLIASQPNFVKKVVFPLELLPLVAVGAALFHALASLAVLVAALAWRGELTLWLLALPLVWAPFLLLLAGLAWFFAALGVFLRDLGQMMGMAITALLFLSPVFYPVSALPAWLQPWTYLNPLSVPIEATRAVLIFGRAPDWVALVLYCGSALACAGLGWLWFAKTRRGFADVL